MAKRSYSQYCPMATALDLLGERWTLLVVRDLLLGPRRYSDLLAGLPGLSTDLLADRLRALEAAGVVRRRKLPPPAPATVYELTDEGRGLEDVLASLGRWGARLMPPAGETDARVDHRWALLSMAAGYHGPAGAEERIELHLDAGGPDGGDEGTGGEVFAFEVSQGRATVRDGTVADPWAVVRTTPATFLRVLAGFETADAAVARGAVEVDGDGEALARLVADASLPFGR